MRYALPILFAGAFLALAGAGAPARAGAAPEEAMAALIERGYTGVEIDQNDAPGYHAWACKDGARFRIEMDADSRIVDVDPVGPCAGGQRDYASGPPAPGHAPSPEAGGHYPPGVLGDLAARGYYDIRVIDRDDDEIEVLACKDGRLYEIEIERGRIDDIDRKGRCGPRRHASDGAHVEAPFASVHTGRGNVDVEAPFTGVHVGRDGVRVRAPFVDLHIPR